MSTNVSNWLGEWCESSDGYILTKNHVIDFGITFSLDGTFEIYIENVAKKERSEQMGVKHFQVKRIISEG